MSLEVPYKISASPVASHFNHPTIDTLVFPRNFQGKYIFLELDLRRDVIYLTVKRSGNLPCCVWVVFSGQPGSG